MIKQIFYIADISLPSTSAYAIHVLKICDRFKDVYNTNLLIPYIDPVYRSKKIKKDFRLKNDIKINGILKKCTKINFIQRIEFAFKVLLFLKKEKKIRVSLIYSRSIITSILLSLFQIKNVLEIHHDLQSFTKIIFNFLYFKFLNKNLLIVLLHNNLKKILPKKFDKFIILDDAVELRDFLKRKIIKKNNLFSCSYFGSLTRGKGVELISKLSKKLPKVHFDIYGDTNFLYDKKLLNTSSNMRFFGHINYSEVLKKMSSYDVVLMPYLNRVTVRSKNLDTAKFMSPLKLFEYMAGAKIIIASKLPVYSHILKNNYNSILLPNNKLNLWVKKINEINKNISKFKYLQKNAFKNVQKYSWRNRVKNILDFYYKSFN